MTKQAYIGIKYYEDNRNQTEIARLSRHLEQAGYTTVCIARDLVLIVLPKERELSSTMAGIATKIIRYNTLEQLDLTSL
ncbi:MAG: hypothetical protein P8183_24575 [Anaerolineae bacterium]